jgi:hypothetical protein
MAKPSAQERKFLDDRRPDLWREPEALANEGCAAVLEAVVETVADATEMLGYHERTEVGDFRAFAALARSIRQDYLATSQLFCEFGASSPDVARWTSSSA